ncbi:MAG: hypothetical protein ACXABJ_00525, partial [Candidatus Heimdallarchaeaceae archaeon]
MKFMNTETNFCLRVDVDTFEGLKIGIPKVVDFALKLECSTTIYLSLGKYATGRNLFRIIRNKEMASKRIPPWKRNHPKSIVRGLLLPPRGIKDKEIEKLQEYNTEKLIEFHPHGYNHVKWSKSFSGLSYEKTKENVKSLMEEYVKIFGRKPIANAAPNFQINKHYFHLLKEEGFSFSSDLFHPIPINLQFKSNGNQKEFFQIPQLPVTETCIEEFILQGKTPDQIKEEYRKRFEECVDLGKEYICLYVHSIFEPIKLNNLLKEIIDLVFKFDMQTLTHS